MTRVIPRQAAVMIVVAVEKLAFPGPVQRIVRAIKIERGPIAPAADRMSR
jgi:hypothetical protein